MKMGFLAPAGALAFSIIASADAQVAQPVSPATVAIQPPAAVPVVVAPQAQSPYAVLPQNTQVVLRLNEELSTKRNDEGDLFYLTVAYDVMLGAYVVIPKGTRATGIVTWKTGKGMLGKSGKMEVEITHLDLNGRRVPLLGKFRQEGEGNTVATVGAVIIIPVAGLLVTGKSGVIPNGREFVVTTGEDIPVMFAAAPVQPAIIAQPPIVQPATAPTYAMPPQLSPQAPVQVAPAPLPSVAVGPSPNPAVVTTAVPAALVPTPAAVPAEQAGQ
jgi:hypothetical protein